MYHILTSILMTSIQYYYYPCGAVKPSSFRPSVPITYEKRTYNLFDEEKRFIKTFTRWNHTM